MFRHVTLFRWVEGTTVAQVESLRRDLDSLPAVIPELRAYRVGADAGLVDANWDFAVVADFDDIDGWRSYIAHAAHQRVIERHIRGMLGERAAVQFQ
ncbi:MAG: Dabb family protein [Acidimicrobiales bacterium]